ncbi:hypothetical protein IV203_013538 [Nitzschia inconspicua]|uniref:Ankyrin repeat protein n=1 Tax=Nitzschia inconspicua TaxID=303405 RepID=A0A9K3Q834_9STRA|nr:hypothetical protein IV203_013538 [Nitzschia inconspicua]
MEVTGRPSRTAIPSSDLWDLVIDMDWERVIEHARQYPHDAAYMDGHYDESVLYLCCQHNPPLEAVQAIRRAFPIGVSMKCREHHDIPIHVACQYQLHVEILQELLRDMPETALQSTRMDRTPIKILWDARCRQETTDHLCRHQERENIGDNLNVPDPSGFVPFEDDSDFWDKVMVLLGAVARNRQCVNGQLSFKELLYKSQTLKSANNSVNVRSGVELASGDHHLLLHAAVSLGSQNCPIEVLKWLLKRFPEQVRKRDSRGILPIHLAIGPTLIQATNRRQYLPRQKDIIAALLKVYPQAAQRTIYASLSTSAFTVHLEKYRYPLMTALRNRHTWSGGVEDLVGAAPGVLLKRDPVTNLYPFQLAATPFGSSTTVDLDTIYRLLRTQPEVVYLMERTPQKEIQPTETMSSPPKLQSTGMEWLINAALAVVLISIFAHSVSLVK